MARATSIEYHKPRVSALGLIRMVWPARRARNTLDVRELPDHLKRDLGILDGSCPVGSVCW